MKNNFAESIYYFFFDAIIAINLFDGMNDAMSCGEI